MSDENNKNEFDFNSSENIKSPSKREILEKVLNSYIPLLDEFNELNSTIDDLEDTFEEDTSNFNTEIDKIRKQVSQNEEDIDKNYETIKEKIIKLVGITKSRAKKDHEHDEFDKLYELENETEDIYSKIKKLINEDGDLQSQVDEILKDINDIESTINNLEEKNEELYDKMTRLAYSHLSLKKEFKSFLEVQDLKNEAHHKSVYEANCDECGEEIDIMSLDKSYCPNCKKEFSNIKSRRIFSNILEINQKSEYD